jgi:hypothetical protein
MMMNSGLDRDFEKFIDEYDEEQENSDLCNPKQWEIDLDKYIDEEYFRFIIPSISNTK